MIRRWREQATARRERDLERGPLSRNDIAVAVARGLWRFVGQVLLLYLVVIVGLALLGAVILALAR